MDGTNLPGGVDENGDSNDGVKTPFTQAELFAAKIGELTAKRGINAKRTG